MAKKEKIEQPNLESQRLNTSVVGNKVDYVEVRGKKWRVMWKRNANLHKVTEILMKESPVEGKRPKEEDYEGNEEGYAEALAKYEREAMKYAMSEDKVVCKCVAALRLDSPITMKLFYGWLWRWYYYVKMYTCDDLLPYISECKKKVPVQSYYASIMLLTGMKDTMMAMTREEVNRFQVAQLMAQRGQ